MPVKAGHSEIIQASEKDDEYKSFFRNSLGDFFRDITGMCYIDNNTNVVKFLMEPKLCKHLMLLQ